MTTLDRNRFLAGKLREFYESHPISTELLEAANALDALSSIPEQGVAEGLREAAEWHKRAALILSSDNPLKAWHTACVAAMNILAEEAALAPSQPAAVGEVEATISDEELRKALRHRASLPETTPTDSYVMMKAERRIGAIASNSEPAMVRICPERDGRCPHGIDCPFAIDRGSCDMIASRAALRSTP
jgi:hypothetical protein